MPHLTHRPGLRASGCSCNYTEVYLSCSRGLFGYLISEWMPTR